MSERNYYVICDDNCRFEGMTKEQIYDAIAEATGATPTPVDGAFITQIKEQNANHSLKMWKGTEAQYNALTEKDTDTVYIVSGANTTAKITDTRQLEETIGNITADVTELRSADFVVEKGTSDGWDYRKWNSGKIECWKRVKTSLVTNLDVSAPIYYGTYRPIAVAPINVLTVDNVQLSIVADMANVWVAQDYSSNQKHICAKVFSPNKWESSDSRNIWISVYLNGTWR